MSLFRDLLIEKKRKPYYCEVEYLEGTGTQYIDTGLDYFADFEVGIQLRTSVSNKALGNGAFYCMQRYNQANPYWYFSTGTGASNSYITSTPITEHHIMKWKDNKIYADGVLLTDFTKSSNTPNRMYLYSADGNNKYPNMIYFCKLWEPNSGLLVRDFIPVLDFSLKPCMYDKISGKLFYNQGTGDDFSYGREIHYVDYIESTGTQYIDTNYAFTDDFAWEIDFDGIDRGKTIFGGRTSSTRTALLYQKTLGQGIETTCPINAMTGDQTPFQLADLSSGHHTVKMSVASNKGSVWVDNVQVYNEQSFTGTYISGVTQAIFADKFGTNDYREQSTSKVYSVKMWQASTLVRDYIPAIDENGVGFMFDKATHTIYDNAGTGLFKYPARDVEYIQSTGTQYIDTGIQPTDTYGYRIKNTYTAGQGEQCAIGCMDSGNRFVGVYTSGSANAISGAWGSFVNFLPSYTWTTGTILDVKCNYKNSRKIIIDNTEMKDISDVHITGTISNSIYIGARHYDSNITKMQGKIYSAEITNNTDTVADFIPVLQDGQAGMLDKVNKVFYPNAGTGTFSTGKIVESRWF